MKKIFIKKHKTSIVKYSWKYWLAVSIELIAIILWTIGILEVQIYHKFNPATLMLHTGGLFFGIGSFLYAKWIKH